MTRLRDLFDESAGVAPPSALSADAVFTAGRRRRSLLLAARTAIVVLTVAAVGGSVAFGSARLTGGRANETGGLPDGSYVSHLAVDGDHLYAVLITCPDSRWDNMPDAPTRTADPQTPPPPPGATKSAFPEPGKNVEESCANSLRVSDDGGRHWSAGSAPSQPLLTSPVPGVLATAGMGAIEISTDGARSWRKVLRTGASMPRVPAGGWAASDQPYSYPENAYQVGKVLGVDPATARTAPLANQPPFYVWDVTYVRSTGVIVALGMQDISRPTFSISRDNGGTWSPARRTPAGAPVLRAPGPMGVNGDAPVTTIDGTRLYIAGDDPATKRPVSYRSDDGGATWKRRNLPGQQVQSSYVAPDGAHVVAVEDGGGTSFVVSRDGGASYQPVRLAGLPAGMFAYFTALPHGGYLATDIVEVEPATQPTYHSTDGWNWRRITVR